MMFLRRPPVAVPDKAATARRVAELIQLRGENTQRLGEQDFRNAAKRYGVEAAALHAFADVESHGGGFAPDGRLVILFEPHIFSRETGGRFDGVTVGPCAISYPKWVPARAGRKLPPGCEVHPYQLGQHGRWTLLSFAADHDFDAALKSASWGAFQILGRNHALLGWPTVWHFVVALNESEHVHINAAMRYLDAHGVLDDFQKGRWRQVITAWNGGGQVDHYLNLFLKRLDARKKAYA